MSREDGKRDVITTNYSYRGSLAQGSYSDIYFNRTREILIKYNHNRNVLMQVFVRNKGIVCGLDEAILMLKACVNNSKTITINALYDGDKVEPYDTVMTIEGNYKKFAHLETIYTGIIARATRIASNTRKVVDEAGGLPVLFFGARFDRFENQPADGYAAHVGGAESVSTEAQTYLLDEEPVGTIPHGLIAAYDGNTALATVAFAEAYPDISCISLVDFENDCVKTSLDVASLMKVRGKKLYGVRLDTSGTMVDKSIMEDMGQFKPTGVCKRLVWKVREALDKHNHRDVKIFVSGGFNPERVKQFRMGCVPVDGYGVGSSILGGNYDVTADVVMSEGKPMGKVGRELRPNPRLELVE